MYSKVLSSVVHKVVLRCVSTGRDSGWSIDNTVLSDGWSNLDCLWALAVTTHFSIKDTYRIPNNYNPHNDK